MTQRSTEKQPDSNPGSDRGRGRTPGISRHDEKRRHPRLHAVMAVEYQVSRLTAREFWQGPGAVRNLSFGGIYFTCKDPLPLRTGQIHQFKFSAAAPGGPPRPDEHLSARGLVLRVEHRVGEAAACGIAVKFLTPLQFTAG